MVDLTPKFVGKVEKGSLKMIDKQKFILYLKGLDGMVWVAITKIKRQRSNNQNAYYWGVVVPIIAEEIGEYDNNYIHGLLKGKFLKEKVMVRGKEYEVIKDSSNLKTMEFEKYLDKVREWASTELNCLIPLPNEIDN